MGFAPPPRRLSRRALLQAGGGCALEALRSGASAILRRSRSLAADQEIEVSTRAVDLVRESTVIDMLGLVTFDWRQLREWHHHPACHEPDRHGR